MTQHCHGDNCRSRRRHQCRCHCDTCNQARYERMERAHDRFLSKDVPEWRKRVFGDKG